MSRDGTHQWRHHSRSVEPLFFRPDVFPRFPCLNGGLSRRKRRHIQRLLDGSRCRGPLGVLVETQSGFQVLDRRLVFGSHESHCLVNGPQAQTESPHGTKIQAYRKGWVRGFGRIRRNAGRALASHHPLSHRVDVDWQPWTLRQAGPLGFRLQYPSQP